MLECPIDGRSGRRYRYGAAVVGGCTDRAHQIPSCRLGHASREAIAVRAFEADDVQQIGDSARHYNHVFVSYASQDRNEVIKRVQTLVAVGVPFFQDVLDLDPGQPWQPELYIGT